MMDSSRPQSSLGDLEPSAFSEKDVLRGNTGIVEHDFSMSMRRMVVTEYCQQAFDLHSGRVHRNQHHGLLSVPGRRWIGLTHNDGQLAAGSARSRTPPFPSRNNVLLAIAYDARLDVGGIRRSHRGLG